MHNESGISGIGIGIGTGVLILHSGAFGYGMNGGLGITASSTSGSAAVADADPATAAGTTSAGGASTASGGSSTLVNAQQGQGVAALLVMLAVLCFIFAYCCWGAPFCRSLCRRHCCCRLEDTSEQDSRFGSTDQAMVATPTIILLPHGRMLVVDGTIFTQFQADTTGLDLVELGESVIRAQRHPRGAAQHPQLRNSQGSILEMDAETPSKESMGSIGCFPPPTYESIYGKEECSDMPPSYSDILLHRFANLPYEIDVQDYYCSDKDVEIEMQSLQSCPGHIIANPINSQLYSVPREIGDYSSQSFPRRHLSRNLSVTSNPLDGYYVDNELENPQGPPTSSSSSSSPPNHDDVNNRINAEVRDGDYERNHQHQHQHHQLQHQHQHHYPHHHHQHHQHEQHFLSSHQPHENRNAVNDSDGIVRELNPVEIRSSAARNVRFQNIDNGDNAVDSPPRLDNGNHETETEDDNFRTLADIRESRV